MKVFNLSTQEERDYPRVTPSAAVIAAWLDDNGTRTPRPPWRRASTPLHLEIGAV